MLRTVQIGLKFLWTLMGYLGVLYAKIIKKLTKSFFPIFFPHDHTLKMLIFLFSLTDKECPEDKPLNMKRNQSFTVKKQNLFFNPNTLYCQL